MWVCLHLYLFSNCELMLLILISKQNSQAASLSVQNLTRHVRHWADKALDGLLSLSPVDICKSDLALPSLWHYLLSPISLWLHWLSTLQLEHRCCFAVEKQSSAAILVKIGREMVKQRAVCAVFWFLFKSCLVLLCNFSIFQ